MIVYYCMEVGRVIILKSILIFMFYMPRESIVDWIPENVYCFSWKLLEREL